jgi:hypothetical protein
MLFRPDFTLWLKIRGATNRSPKLTNICVKTPNGLEAEAASEHEITRWIDDGETQ